MSVWGLHSSNISVKLVWKRYFDHFPFKTFSEAFSLIYKSNDSGLLKILAI